MGRNYLIVAPHPDDEVLGCGGIIKKANNDGHQVYVLILTKGSPKLYSEEKIINVRKEALDAHKILGVKQTVFMDYHAPELDSYPISDIAMSIAAVIEDLKIEVLFLPHRGDIHNDHAVAYKAGIVASRPVGNYFVNEIYCYETLSETEWAPPFGDDAFIPTYFVNISEFMPHKLDAMMCFKSQLKNFPHPRSKETIEALAKFRGSTVGYTYAEAFMTVRIIQ